MLFGLLGDLGRLGDAGMVLPQPGLGGQIVAERRLHGQRRPFSIDRQRRRAGRIDADADDVLDRETAIASGDRDRLLDRLEKALDVVGGVLPGEIGVFRIEQDARLAAGIREDRGGHLAAVGRIDDECPHAVRTVIDADGESPLLSHEIDPSLGLSGKAFLASHSSFSDKACRCAARSANAVIEGVVGIANESFSQRACSPGQRGVLARRAYSLPKLVCVGLPSGHRGGGFCRKRGSQSGHFAHFARLLPNCP